MDMRPARQASRVLRPAEARKQGRSRDGNDLDRNQKLAAQSRIMAEAMPDRDIDPVADEIDQSSTGHDPQIDIGMGVVELLEAWHQPGAREEWRRADRQRPRPGVGGDAP